MVPSQKSRYAVRAVSELAKKKGSGSVKAGRITKAQYIPVRSLENILSQLCQAGIVESVHGKKEGYRLRRAPEDMSAGEVIRWILGPISVVDCPVPGSRSGAGAGADARARRNGRECPLRPGCVPLPMWDKAHRAMMDVYDTPTFEDLVEQEIEAHECEALNYTI